MRDQGPVFSITYTGLLAAGSSMTHIPWSLAQNAHLLKVGLLVLDDLHGQPLMPMVLPDALHNLPEGALPQHALHHIPAAHSTPIVSVPRGSEGENHAPPDISATRARNSSDALCRCGQARGGRHLSPAMLTSTSPTARIRSEFSLSQPSLLIPVSGCVSDRCGSGCADS